MYVIYDPNDQNQIVALYSDRPVSTSWRDRGYLMTKVEGMLARLVSQAHRLEFDGAEVIEATRSPRSTAPQPTENEILHGRLKSKLNTGDDLSLSELNQYLRGPR